MPSPTTTAHRSWYGAAGPSTLHCPPAPREVAAFHAALPQYAPTPLTELPALAAELGVHRVFVKDESARLGLPAFKALGAFYAIHRTIAEWVGEPVPGTPEGMRDRLTGRIPPRLCTATDGNHGRAVARMAALLEIPAVVFVPATLDAEAIAAIEAEGAVVRTVAAEYDEVVRAAAGFAAADPGTELVQDTAWPGYERVPGWIVDGYSTLFTEVDEQLAAAGASPDLVAVPVGVGSLAQATVRHYRGTAAVRPRLLAVEPETAACLTDNLHAGQRRSIRPGPTIMAGLHCGTVSALAWPYLRDGLDAAVTVTDEAAAEASAALAALGVSSGPCGSASLAAVRFLVADKRSPGPGSTLVLLSTEHRAAR
ncbi:diaminopropionate ammonia-lyase [Sciscionella marina]|uniref:diaminopropionate ammonia-lyase n=1 Tax=Sciscionella marina TaxID=508770 RepID=UPI000A041DE9|nr:diaminopropionate ammonia-lyase [Sciscionella marina]